MNHGSVMILDPHLGVQSLGSEALAGALRKRRLLCFGSWPAVAGLIGPTSFRLFVRSAGQDGRHKGICSSCVSKAGGFVETACLSQEDYVAGHARRYVPSPASEL